MNGWNTIVCFWDSLFSGAMLALGSVITMSRSNFYLFHVYHEFRRQTTSIILLYLVSWYTLGFSWNFIILFVYSSINSTDFSSTKIQPTKHHDYAGKVIWDRATCYSFYAFTYNNQLTRMVKGDPLRLIYTVASEKKRTPKQKWKNEVLDYEIQTNMNLNKWH